MGLEKINEYKKKLGITTDELSRSSGVPVGTLNKILSGATKDPKLETLKAIARVLGLTLNDFDDVPHPSTLAAHLNGNDDLTEEEIDNICAYVEFVKNRRNKKQELAERLSISEEFLKYYKEKYKCATHADGHTTIFVSALVVIKRV